jgi:hypothetical protein
MIANAVFAVASDQPQMKPWFCTYLVVTGVLFGISSVFGAIAAIHCERDPNVQRRKDQENECRTKVSSAEFFRDNC